MYQMRAKMRNQPGDRLWQQAITDVSHDVVLC
jgi:hypothetical protein